MGVGTTLVALLLVVVGAASPAAAQAPVGRLSVESVPSRAKVILDGTDLDEETPFGPAELPAGSHTVELRLPGFPPERRQVDVRSGLDRKVIVRFQTPSAPPAPTAPTAPVLPSKPARDAVGSVRIESDPAGAAVYFGGVARGQTPVELSDVVEGAHDFRLELAGHLAHAGKVTVKAGESVTATAKLFPTGGGGGGAGGGYPAPRGSSGGAAVVFLTILVILGGGVAAALVVVKKKRRLVVEPTPSRGVPVQAFIVFGDYQVTEKVASGGMANIYKAVHRKNGNVAVVKVPYEQFQHDKTFVERFLREGNLGRRLHNENIVKIYETGTTREGLTYIAMEYIDGQDLRHFLTKGVSIEEAVDFTSQVCRALDYVHSKQIIHRDIKPENVMVSRGRPHRAVLMDFGIARAGFLGTIGTGSTYLGTPYYMAPEPANGSAPGPYSDLYAVGVMFFEMLTGRRPFEGDNPVAVLQSHVSAPVPSPRQFNDKIPARLEAIALKLLAKRPEDRYQSADEVIVELQEFALGLRGREL